ncbi:hypothetical protein [Streptomyces qinglanensis]|uniref:Uncharacterized protein n=1 Tax=Streptomyces qinglanensis TaxID=943816 RepID=A0A1H9V9C5_9ACTN|nr:hypothetical protein [Streptomyces qinglanensis]SES18014.1 hypothetical protein SAMN05421870_1116 [Streptomyces qinglanensis]
MANSIPQFVRWLLQRLLPGAGRHRIVEAASPAIPGDTLTLMLPRVHRVFDRSSLRGEDVRLVRPYVVAHEKREAQQRDRLRRGVLAYTRYDMAVMR